VCARFFLFAEKKDCCISVTQYWASDAHYISTILCLCMSKKMNKMIHLYSAPTTKKCHLRTQITRILLAAKILLPDPTQENLYPVYTIKLARRAGYMLVGPASSMFARRLLDICSMFVMLYACFIFARCLLDVCWTFVRRLLDVCLMFARCFAGCLLDVCSIM